MTADQGDALLLGCLLWAHPGREAGLRAYEDHVLAFVTEHGGEVLQRATTDGRDGNPHEIQLYRFTDQAALEQYMNDPRRLAAAAERERVIARSEVFPVTLRPSPGRPPGRSAWGPA